MNFVLEVLIRLPSEPRGNIYFFDSAALIYLREPFFAFSGANDSNRSPRRGSARSKSLRLDGLAVSHGTLTGPEKYYPPREIDRSCAARGAGDRVSSAETTRLLQNTKLSPFVPVRGSEM